jgi:hypothetical protein
MIAVVGVFVILKAGKSGPSLPPLPFLPFFPLGIAVRGETAYTICHHFLHLNLHEKSLPPAATKTLRYGG